MSGANEYEPASNQDFDFNVPIHATEKAISQTAIEIPNRESQNNQPDTINIQAQITNQETNETYKENRPQAESDTVTQFFHIIFKALAILFFFIFEAFSGDATITFILVIIFDAFDFWVVKNITGRRLVGLKWMSKIQEDGKEIWVYESMPGDYQPNESNQSVFWLTQTIATLLWLVLTFLDFISMKLYWALLSLIGLITVGLNFVGFYRCRGEHQDKAKQFAKNIGFQVVQQGLRYQV